MLRLFQECESDDEKLTDEEARDADGVTDLDTVRSFEAGMVRGMGKVFPRTAYR
jgi:hypothetical protein